MEHFFTYILKDNDEILRIGKGHSYSKTAHGVTNYIKKRPAYKQIPANEVEFYWCASESAALNKENAFLNEYLEMFGELPPYNNRRGGGGRQLYCKCKGFLADGSRCRKDALTGNYGYCGIHRR